MPTPASTVDDLVLRHPTFGACVAHFATEHAISLNRLWEVGGRKSGGNPLTWLKRRGVDVADGVRVSKGHVIADANTALQYLLDTDQEILSVAVNEVGRAVADDPIGFVADHADAMTVAVARLHLVRDRGMTDAQACGFLMDGVGAVTANVPEHRRESIIAELRRSMTRSPPAVMTSPA